MLAALPSSDTSILAPVNRVLAVYGVQTTSRTSGCWLTHFLMYNRFDDLMQFYCRLAELPPDLVISPSVFQQLFDEVFGEDHTSLDLQWRSYMNGLKTDVERHLESARR